MGRRDDSTEWEQLDDPVRTALDHWLDGKPWNLHFRSWFRDGHSGSPVALVARSGAGTDDQIVLKFFLCGAEEVRNWKAAWIGCPIPQFKERHLVDLADESQLVTEEAGPWIASLKIVGGNPARFRPLSEMSLSGDIFSTVCETIVTSVVAEWNDYPGRPKSRDVTVNGYLRSIIDHKRLMQSHKFQSWADITSVPIKASLFSRTGWDLLPNPITVISNKTMTTGQNIRMLRGCAHGDLHIHNILMPIKPPEPNEYKLIDLGGYAYDSPLARDPMHLLLSIAWGWMLDGINFGSKLSRSIIEVIVDPDEGVDEKVKPYQEVSQTIHRAGRVWAEENGWGEEWTRQSLLSLVACALQFLDKDLRVDDPSAAREWFFDLAAVAARSYMIRNDSWTEYQHKYFERPAKRRRMQAVPDSITASAQKSTKTADAQSSCEREGATILPFSRLHAPSDSGTDSSGAAPSTDNQGTWSSLVGVLRNTSFDGTDWTALAANSETLRRELGRERSPHPASDQQIRELLQDLSRTLAGALTPSASCAQLNRACSQANLLQQWLLDLLAEPGR
jgi:hypothetical protein